MTATLSFAVCLAVCGVAALTDWRSFRIPNWLTLPALGLGLGLAALHGVSGVLAALLGVLVCGLVPLALCLAGAMGGGDFKLLSAVGALLGARVGLEAELYAFIAGSAWGLGLWIVRGRLIATARRLVERCRRQERSSTRGQEPTRMRFAPSILVGVIAALLGLVGVP